MSVRRASCWRRDVTVAVTVAALSGGVSMAAQPSPAQAPRSEKMTLSGCLRGAGASSGGSTAAPQSVVYTLDVVAAAGKQGETALGGKPKAPTTPALYSLAAPAAVGLAKHVNHRVEVTGHMREAQATTTGTPGKPSPEAPEALDPTMAAANRTFEVESLKMVSANCPAPRE